MHKVNSKKNFNIVNLINKKDFCKKYSGVYIISFVFNPDLMQKYELLLTSRKIKNMDAEYHLLKGLD